MMGGRAAILITLINGEWEWQWDWIVAAFATARYTENVEARQQWVTHK